MAPVFLILKNNALHDHQSRSLNTRVPLAGVYDAMAPHPHAIIHGNEAGCVPFPLIPLLQEQQKILRGRFGCHHLYPMH